MKNTPQGLIYSPSDLNLFTISPFASWMERYALENPEWADTIEQDTDQMMSMLAEKGDQHEQAYLNTLKSSMDVDQIVVISSTSTESAYAQTLKAIKLGVSVIFQAYLKRDQFAGYADFLFRVDGQSDLGDYHYEVWDTKLSRSVKPYFLLQLSAYSWMLEVVQGRRPLETAVVLGDQSIERFRLANYFHYFLMVKQGFLTAQESFINDLSAQPNPELSSEYGRWESYAKEVMQARDSLRFVANIRSSQIEAMHEVGIETLTDLADSVRQSVKGIGDETFKKLRIQAQVQRESRESNRPAFRVNGSSEKGLARLPVRSESDLFFDIEGHPLMTGGLEYCWGVSHYGGDPSTGKRYAFKEWWAHDARQEREAFEGFIDWVYQRWQADPGMHIFHYASYEVTALRKLSTRYHTRQQEVGELLSHGVLIDLYSIVRNGLVIGASSYSIKNVEHLYRGKRETEVASGGESVVVYEQWREAGGATAWAEQENGYALWKRDPEAFDWSVWPVLESIRDYNIDDCESTLDLVSWLRELKTAQGIEYHQPEEREEEVSDAAKANQARREALRARQDGLIEQYDHSESLQEDPVAALLISLIGFYQREQKVGIWAYFDRLEKDEDSLFDDPSAIAGVVFSRQGQSDKGPVYRGLFDNRQPVRKDKFQSAEVFGTSIKSRKIEFLPSNNGHQDAFLMTLSSPVPADADALLLKGAMTLLGQETFINTETLEGRLCDITESYFHNGELSPLLQTLLNREPPRFVGVSPLPITRTRYRDDDEYNEAVRGLVKSLNQSCLCIQGPPGAGKTFTAKHVIKSLVEAGYRVGIMSNSHAAINNLLMPICESLPNYQLAKVGPGGKTAKEFAREYPPERYPNLYFRGNMKFPKKVPYDEIHVVGATAFGFAHDTAVESPLDYLFVDEASQVALANLIAVSPSTKNIVLMGDQMQLEQPIQGSHPGDAGRSALEFMLRGHAVIPEEQGLFLERTYRMHPDVCAPLSELVYEDKLKAAPGNEEIAIRVDCPERVEKSFGIQSISVEHHGNMQSSLEEVQVIEALIEELMSAFFIDKEGVAHPIKAKDILIVAPYNMQVNLLQEELGEEFSIGTIDKFQGQEAPIVIISLGVSDVSDSSRGLDFVFDINRLNVAISRAKALAIVVANEGIARCSAGNLEQMRKINLICRLLGL